MTVDPGPQRRDIRVSDQEREGVAERLRVAAGDGRLTLDELEQRLEDTYAARTYGELEPLVADLPPAGQSAGQSGGRPAGRASDERAAGPAPRHRDVVEINQHGGSTVRRGRWPVPRRLVVNARYGSALLDFSEAILPGGEVEIELNREYGATRVVVPRGSVVDADDVEMHYGSLKNKASGEPEPLPGAARFRVTGHQRYGSVTIAPERRLRIGRLTIHFPFRVTWRRD